MRFLWMAAAAALLVAGCATKTDPYTRHSGNSSGQGGQNQQNQEQNPDSGNTTPKEITPTLNKTWQVKYAGRKHLQGHLVEVIEVNNVAASQQFLVSVINRENYATYEGDLKAFLENEWEVNGEYVYTGAPQVIQFDPFRHGTWYAFVIGLDSNKRLTGEYAYAKFTVEEEEASEEFNRWLGQWTVSDGQFSYHLNVSSLEANFVYRVDGWETGSGIGTNMDQEYLETFFEESDGSMYFVSQYIQSYNDESMNGTLVDEFFLGQVDYDGITEPMGLYIITEEGMDLACAYFDSHGAVVLEPCTVTAEIGQDSYTGPFYCMQYFFTEGTNWYTYNDNTAAFPVTMVKVEDQPQPQPQLFRRQGGEVRQKALRGKVYQPRSGRTVKAVKR